jgi:hypothetical protein
MCGKIHSCRPKHLTVDCKEEPTMGRTDSLFAHPSLLMGFARALDLGATFRHHSYNEARTPQDADEMAIFSDFATTGEDIRDAIAVTEADVLGAR